MVKVHFRSCFILSFILLLFVGCNASLAPEYDKAIVEKTIATSEATMGFLEKVAQGTKVEGFKTRENQYNQLIGAYDALNLQASARPVPKSVALDKINKLLQTKGSGSISGDYPSAYAFEKIAETLRKMKKTDREKGLGPTAVQAFKGQIAIYLDQAITYESFLKR